MDTFLLQDWITIGDPAASTITQGASEWLDLGEYQDAVIWLELRRPSSTFSIQTAPARDERLFLPVAQVTQGAGTFVYVLQVGDSPVFNTNSPAQIARWLRWTAKSTTSNWTATFRITVMANRQGRG